MSLLACEKKIPLVRMEHAFGYSIPLPANFNPTTLHEYMSDSTGTVTYLQGESPELVSLAVWVQARNVSLEDYFPEISQVSREWTIIEQSEDLRFTGQNSYGGLHQRLRYRQDIQPNDSTIFTRDLWVVGHEDYFYSFFWTVPQAKEAKLKQMIEPGMRALRFIPRQDVLKP